MSKNSGFQFKQFFIEHIHCAMKVGTDSIMLGSWVSTCQAKRILDIGCGSGILSLMLAQKTTNDCQIHGIDVDAGAVKQAIINSKNCPWHDRLIFSQVSMQNFHSQACFDVIVSNPPYFSAYTRTCESTMTEQNK